MFGMPHRHTDMMRGVKAALNSPKTPQHLKAHLQKRVMKATPLPVNTVPAQPNNFPPEITKTAPMKPMKKVKLPALFGGPR